MTDTPTPPRQWRADRDLGFLLGEDWVRAAFGQGGFKPEAEKREGDGATPIGLYPIRRVLYRPDRLDRPDTALPVRPISADDGWCDEPGDPAYNRPVRLPYPASHEEMMREDELYDLVLVLGHNDDPPVQGAGSAIFLHCKRGDYQPTRGCIALAQEHVLALLSRAKPGDLIAISAD